jgi:hypothetical protein
MRQKSGPEKQPAEDAIKDIRRGDASTLFGRGEDPRRAGRAPRRGEHCRTVPPRGHRLVDVLWLVERVPSTTISGPPARASDTEPTICSQVFAIWTSNSSGGTTGSGVNSATRSDAAIRLCRAAKLAAERSVTAAKGAIATRYRQTRPSPSAISRWRVVRAPQIG